MQRSPARGEAPMHIYVIHENAAWLEPLARALDAEKVPWRDWFLDQGMFDVSKPPPVGVFYNRMSASSHTRDHRYAAELTASVLAWLARHGRRVINGPRALDLEISKSRQYAALEAAGIHTPRTVLVAGRQNLVVAAPRHFDGGPVRPAGAEEQAAPRAKFTIIEDIDAGLKQRYEAFLAANGIEVAGIEFISGIDGATHTYDVNTNTNYNPDAEARAGRSAMTAL